MRIEQLGHATARQLPERCKDLRVRDRGTTVDDYLTGARREHCDVAASAAEHGKIRRYRNACHVGGSGQAEQFVSGANDAPATPPTIALGTALRLVGLLFPPHHGDASTPAISPVLSPRLLISRPALLTTVRCKFDIVVNSGIVRCCPPRIVPQPPPTSITGNG